MKTARFVLFFCCCLMSAGCLPVVQHGPWVRHGVSGGAVAGGAYLSDGSNSGGAVISGDASARIGLAANDSTFTGFGIGASLPLVTLFAVGDIGPGGVIDWATLDGYLTGPGAFRYATSAGAHVSAYHVMPYVQAGSRTPNAGGWYTTQAVLLSREWDMIMWLPSYTRVQSQPGARNATHLTLTAGIGEQEDQMKYMLMVSIGFEFFKTPTREKN